MGRVNYGQNANQLNALAGLISLSAKGKSLWAIEGGNQQLCVRLFEHIKARVMLNCKVTGVARVPNSPTALYEVILQTETARGTLNRIA